METKKQTKGKQLEEKLEEAPKQEKWCGICYERELAQSYGKYNQ